MPDLTQPFRELCDEYGMDLAGAARYSGEEDAAAYLDPTEASYELAPFVLVTKSGEYAYLRCYATRGDAIAAAFENVDDDIFAEAPVAVVNLETGARIVPDFDACPWKPVAR